jgi:superfamily II helicase
MNKEKRMDTCRICKRKMPKPKLTKHHRRHGGIRKICSDCHKKINRHQKFRRKGNKIWIGTKE